MPPAARIALAVLALNSPVFGQGDLIFEDGFETGNTAAWSSTVPEPGPLIHVSAPEALVVNDPRPEIVVEYQDRHGDGLDLGSLLITLDGLNIGFSCSVGREQAICSPPLVGGGSHALVASVADFGGRVGQTSVTFEVLMDGDPPYLEILEPLGTLESVTPLGPTVVVEARDLGSGLDLETLSVSIDAGAGSSCGAPEEGIFHCPTSPLTAGGHTIEASVADRAGNVATASAVFELVIDGVAPSLRVLHPSSATVFLATPALELELAYQDRGVGLDLSSLSVLLDGEDHADSCFVEESAASCTIPVDTAPATYRMEVAVADLVGNVATTARILQVTVDETAPSVSIINPQARSYLGTAPAIAAVLADEGVGIDEPGLSVTISGSAVASCDLGPGGDLSCPAPSLPPGAHVLVVEAADLAGNATRGVRTFHLAEVDRTGPDLAILEPTGGLILGVPALRASYTDPSGVDLGSLRVTLDGLDVTESCLTGPEEVTCDLAGAGAGPHVAAFVIADDLGHPSTAAVAFEVELQVGVEIESPAEGDLVSASEINVAGSVEAGSGLIRLGEETTSIAEDGTFLFEGVPLHEGANVLTVVAETGSGAVGAATVTVVLDTQAPRVAIHTPVDGSTSFDQSIVVAGQVVDPASSSTAAVEPTVWVNGVPAEVRNGAFIARDVLLHPLENRIEVVARDGAGNEGTGEVRVVAAPVSGPRLEILRGQDQEGVAGGLLSEPLVVRAVDVTGAPLPFRPVRFAVTRGSGELASASTPARDLEVRTGTDGIAQVAAVRLGRRAGEGVHQVTATLPGLPGSVVFLASARPGPPATIRRFVGNRQRGDLVALAGEELPLPLRVQLFDELGNPVPGIDVRFRVLAGGGSFPLGAEAVVTTDSEGKASTRFRLGPKPGLSAHLVEATFDGLAGLPALFPVNGVEPSNGATRLVGIALDNEDQPVPGVTVWIEHTELETSTDAEGRFELTDVPLGTIHLITDATTTTRPGVWPVLAFQIVTFQGIENTLGMPVRLLPLDVGSRQMVSETQGATVVAAEVEGGQLTVEAGAATFPGGSREGFVMFTQVHNDKVPMVAPRGGNFTSAWTVQPAGVHFDPPATFQVPNLDEPPGAIVDLFSFDHDLGEFVSIGTGEVSEDARFVTSMPGSGVVKAGWHGAFGPPPPPTNICRESECRACEAGSGMPVSRCEDCEVCQGGDCVPKEITELRIEVEGDDGGADDRVLVAKAVQFEAVVRPQECLAVYEWDFGDGETGDEREPAHLYEQPGTYMVSLRVYCEECPTVDETDTLEVDVIELDLMLDGLPEETEEGPNEKEPGALVIVNADDDNENETPDHEDDGIVGGEDNLRRLTLVVDPSIDTGEVRLEARSGGDSIRVWEDHERGTEVELPKTWALESGRADPIPEELWLEGVQGGAVQGTEVALVYAGESAEADDTVRVTVPPIRVILAPTERGGIVADFPEDYLTAGLFIEDEDSEMKIGDGTVIRWEVLSGGGSLDEMESQTEDGFATVRLASPTTVGTVHRVRAVVKKLVLEVGSEQIEVQNPGLQSRVAELEVVAGPAASLQVSASRTTLPADGTSTAEVTVQAFDTQGNPVVNGTLVSWLLNGSVAEPIEGGQATIGGSARATVYAPPIAEPFSVTVLVDGLGEEVQFQVERVNGDIAPVSSRAGSRVILGETVTLAASFDAGDGTPVYWGTSAGVIRSTTDLQGGVATAELDTDGASSGPVWVTASAGDRMVVWEGRLVPESGIEVYPRSQYLVPGEVGQDTVEWTRIDGSTVTVPTPRSTVVELQGFPNEVVQVVGFGSTTVEAYVFEGLDGKVVPGIVSGVDLELARGASLSQGDAATGQGALDLSPGGTGRIAEAPALQVDGDFALDVSVKARTASPGPLVRVGSWLVVELEGSGRVTCRFDGGGGEIELTTSGSLPIGQWTTLTVELAGGELVLSALGETLVAGVGGAPGVAVFNGAILGGSFDGLLDDLAIHQIDGPLDYDIAGVDAAGLIVLDGSGYAEFEIVASEPLADRSAVLFNVNSLGARRGTLGSGSLGIATFRCAAGPGPGCYAVHLVVEEIYKPVAGVLLAVVGGDVETTPEMVAGLAGGVLLFGITDAGAIIKNVYRWKWLGQEPDRFELVLSTISLVIEIAPLIGDILVDVPVNVIRVLVLRLGDSPLVEVLHEILTRRFSLDVLFDSAQRGFLNALRHLDGPLLGRLGQTIDTRSLYEAAVHVCKRADVGRATEAGGRSVPHQVILESIGNASTEVGQRMWHSLWRADSLAFRDFGFSPVVNLSARNPDEIIAAMAGLEKILRHGPGLSGVPPEALVKALAGPGRVLTSTYDEVKFLTDLGDVAGAKNLATLLRRMGAIPILPFARGFRYELEGAAQFARARMLPIEEFGLRLPKELQHGINTDFDAVLAGYVLQMKSTVGALLGRDRITKEIDPEVGLTAAKRWIDAARNEHLGGRSIVYVLPPEVRMAMTDKFIALFRDERVEIFEATFHRTRMEESAGEGTAGR